MSNSPAITTQIVYDLEAQPALTCRSKCIIVSLVVSGIAGIVIFTLGSMNLFGGVQSADFIATIATGGVLAFLAIGGLTRIAIAKPVQHVHVYNTLASTAPSEMKATDEQILLKDEERLLATIPKNLEEWNSDLVQLNYSPDLQRAANSLLKKGKIYGFSIYGRTGIFVIPTKECMNLNQLKMINTPSKIKTQDGYFHWLVYPEPQNPYKVYAGPVSNYDEF